MKKIQLGDIFEIQTSKGFGYIHYIYEDKSSGSLVRVLSGVYASKPTNLDDIAQRPEQFMIFFPLVAARNRKIVTLVGHHDIDAFPKPAFMRSEHNIRGQRLGWHIINTDTWQRKLVAELTEEYRKLSPWGIWNDTLLIERLDSNWKLSEWT